MCADYRTRVELGTLGQDWSETRIPLRFPEGRPNMEPRDDVRITDRGPIIRMSAAEAGAAELVQRRWSWPGPTGKPVFNFRADGRQFGSGRCLVVADGFYEFTAREGAPARAKKDKWLFTLKGHGWFCIAGLWRTDPKVGEAFTLLTMPPGPDVAPFHDRQIAILPREDWARWLDTSVPASEVLRTLPAGSFEVAQV